MRRRVILEESGEEDMDKWEQIIDYTTEEDQIEKIITTDDNGNTFRLRKAIVSIKVLPVEGVTSSYAIKLSVTGKGNVWTGPHLSLCLSPKEGEKYRRGYIRLEEIMGKIHPTNAYISYNTSSVPDTMREMDNQCGYGVFEIDDETLMPKNDGPITKIGFGSYTKCIGAGSRIVVLGVRA